MAARAAQAERWREAPAPRAEAAVAPAAETRRLVDRPRAPEEAARKRGTVAAAGSPSAAVAGWLLLPAVPPELRAAAAPPARLAAPRAAAPPPPDRMERRLRACPEPAATPPSVTRHLRSPVAAPSSVRRSRRVGLRRSSRSAPRSRCECGGVAPRGGRLSPSPLSGRAAPRRRRSRRARFHSANPKTNSLGRHFTRTLTQSARATRPEERRAPRTAA